MNGQPRSELVVQILHITMNGIQCCWSPGGAWRSKEGCGHTDGGLSEILTKTAVLYVPRPGSTEHHAFMREAVAALGGDRKGTTRGFAARGTEAGAGIEGLTKKRLRTAAHVVLTISCCGNERVDQTGGAARARAFSVTGRGGHRKELGAS